MRIKYAETIQPLFLNGKNFGTKLDAKRNPDLRLDYNSKERELTAFWKGQTAIFPNFNGYLVEWDESAFKPVVSVTPVGRVKAQASTPAGIKND
jgi:hypothetical protein